MAIPHPNPAVMSLEFEHGVLFRARTGASELFDSPLSRRSARDVARLLARRWRADVEVVLTEGTLEGRAVIKVSYEASQLHDRMSATCRDGEVSASSTSRSALGRSNGRCQRRP